MDYPGIGPEHSWLHDIGRIKYLSTTDEQSLAAFKLCSSLEGIIPALEPAHALHITGKLALKEKANYNYEYVVEETKICRLSYL